MLSFYEFNLTTLIVIFVTTIIVYTLLDKYDREKNNYLNCLWAITIGIILSIAISYLTLESDILLTEPFWE